jgi:hypothetical protein
MRSVKLSKAMVGRRRSTSWDHRVWVIALLALCSLSLWLRFSHIQAALPYPNHVDEPAVLGPARRMLVTGDLHPGSFNYPSLPKYLAAAGLAGGFLQAARAQEIRNVRQIGRVVYPYYKTPNAVEGAKQLFALLSVLALGVTGVVCWLVTQHSAAILVGPLVLMSSKLFFSHSWRYLNVDIVGTCFVILTIAGCLLATKRPSVSRSAVIPGLLAGLSAASKYTLGVVAIPVLLWIWLYQDRDRLLATVVALAASCVAFVVVVPYSILDVPAFLNGLAAEARHYASGHVGFDGAPGMGQLRYYAGHFLGEFGIVGAGLAVLGLVSVAARDARRALIFVAFPVALITLLAVQRVHFPRNVLPIHPIYAVLIGAGLVALYQMGARIAEHRGWSGRHRQYATVAFACVLIVATSLPSRFLAQIRVTADSRNLAQSWVAQNVPSDWTVIIPSALAFDYRELEDRGFKVVEVDVSSPQQQLDMVASVQEKAVAFVPTWGIDGRFVSELSPREMNAATPTMRVLHDFGDNPVLLNSRATAWGNPKFRIVSR